MTTHRAKPGKVYLVGAGPGHPDLLTIKGQELIRRAEIIIYDRLIQEDVLCGARADAEKIYVGKKPGLHQSRQVEINTLLVQAAYRATLVVRLKGGDPVLFGRGGEEAEYLADHGVPFEIVPGVTAGLSVPMAAGIPVTHRDYSASVALVTGHRRDDRETPEVDWGALAKIDTLVFFMSVGKLPEISKKLIEHGCPREVPAAVIQKAYWPGEDVVVGTLESLPRLAEAAGIRPPATIVIGEVVRVRDRLTTLHRDLRRGQDEAVELGLSAEALLGRIDAALRGGKQLKTALQLKIFDELDEATTPEDLAGKRKLDAAVVRELLTCLAGLGLLVRDHGTFRNAEAASRFLSTRSGAFLGARLDQMLQQAEEDDPGQRILPTPR